MVKSKKHLAIAIVLAGIGFNSYAQFGGAGGSGGMRHSRGGDSQGSKANEVSGRSSSRLEQVNNKLYDLRIRLLITPDQSPAWEKFRAGFIDLATYGGSGQSNPDEQTALQATQRQLDTAQNRFVLAENLNDASKALFAALSPDQQRMADQLLPRLLAESGGDGGQGAMARR